MVQIASAKLGTAHPQLTRLAIGYRLSVLTHDIQAVGAWRLADGDVVFVAFDGMTRHHAAAFRRPVDIEEPQSRGWCHGSQFLTACRHAPQRLAVVHHHKLAGRHGTHDDVGDCVVVDELCQTYEVEPHLLGYNIQGGASGERRKDVLYCGDERETGIGSHAAAAVDGHCLLRLLNQTGDVALLYHAALRLSRRSTGIDEQGKVVLGNGGERREK